MSNLLNSTFAAAKGALNSVSVGALISDINNYGDLANLAANGWIPGNEPLLSNMYIFQPYPRKGNYIPRQLVKGVVLPDRTIATKTQKFRGVDLKFPAGSSTGEFTVTFYERQDLIVTGFYEAWKSYAASPSGGFYGLPNQVKQDMMVILNTSMSFNSNTITGKIGNALPGVLNSIANSLNFAGVALLMGCFPISVSYPALENPDDGKVNAVEVQITFSCDVCVKIPMSLNIDQILEILGTSQDGIMPTVGQATDYVTGLF